jgi:hypothetical protein
VASGSDLKAFVRSRVDREPLPEVPLTRGWRGEAVLPELQAILDGKHAVRVENLRAAAPLEFLPVVENETAVSREAPPRSAAGDKL